MGGSWLENNKRTKVGMFQMLARKRKMERWVAQHGSSDDRDRLLIEDWLKDNAVTVCPPYGHGKDD